MTRAVIELSGDISPAMSHMSRLIEGCAYNPGANIMGFRVKGMGVIVEAHKITINNAEDETEARRVVDWLRDVVNTADADNTWQRG
jgi:ArsR family metal-binding transcriptional regulator